MFFISENQLFVFIEDFVASLFALNNKARIEKKTETNNKSFYLLEKNQRYARLESITKPPFLSLESEQDWLGVDTKIEHLLDYLSRENLQRLEKDHEFTTDVMGRYRGEFSQNDMVYEYFNSGNKRILHSKQKQYITFTDPKSFNDPFDCDFAPINEVFLAQTIAYCAYQHGLGQYFQLRNTLLSGQAQSILKDWSQTKMPILLNSENLEFQTDLYLNSLFVALNDYLPRDNYSQFPWRPFFDDVENKIVKTIQKIEGFRILCTAASYEKILMWSYYANKHQGACIGRKIVSIVSAMKNKRAFTGHLCVYGKVVYSLNRPRYSLRCGPYSYKYVSDAFLFNYLIQYAFTKFKDWSHEEEYRFAVIDCQSFRSRVQVKGTNEELYYGCKNSQGLALNIPSTQPARTLHKDPNKYRLN